MTPTLCSAYSERQYTGVIMALLVGVNPGCYLTIIGAYLRKALTWGMWLAERGQR